MGVTEHSVPKRDDESGVDTGSETAAEGRPVTAMAGRDKLAEFRGDLRSAERRAGGEVDLGRNVIVLAALMVGLAFTFFAPHSGFVLGYDVLLDTEVAHRYFTMLPERIYTSILLVGVLLVLATILTRSSIVAFVTWVVSCIQAAYSVFAGWMRQSRPPSEASEGIGWGLALGIALSILLAITMSYLVFRRTSFQAALFEARREEVHNDPVLRAQQQYLRSGLIEHTGTDVAMVDDRRERSKRRRAQREAEAGESAGETDGTGTSGTAGATEPDES